MKIQLKKLKTSKREPKLQLNLLDEQEELKSKYAVTVKNKFAVLDALSTVEERWQVLKESITEAAKEHIPITEKRSYKKWMTQEIKDPMEERRGVKLDEARYKELSKTIKKKCKEAKEYWINTQCREIEIHSNNSIKYMHQKIKEVTGKSPSPRSGCIKSKEGYILMDKSEILHRWLEYIEDLYDDQRGPAPVINTSTGGLPILKEEVEQAMQRMKKGKAAGPDNVPIELITALEETGVEEVTKLLNIIYETGKLPEDFTKSLFIALPTKPGTTECEQHRTISLMGHLTKILLTVLMCRMRNKIRSEISEMQFGFVADKGTCNPIFTLSMLLERSTKRYISLLYRLLKSL